MINYNLISLALDSYVRCYQYSLIDVPWTVSKEAIDVTLPPHLMSFVLNDDKHLVGSAEQSFIQMMLNNDLKPGRYVTATPCFRDEIEDELHQSYFFKVELIDCRLGLTKRDVDDIKNCAHNVLSYLLHKSNFYGELQSVTTSSGYDIELNGIEIGSYGLRKYKDLTWIYGTGLAEPRFSKAMEKYV